MKPQDFFSPGDSRVLGWVFEALQEGESIVKQDPGYSRIDSLMEYVLGNQLKGPRPSYLPQMVINQTKKALLTHTAALTDIKPLFNYKTMNPQFQEQAALLNNLIVSWWVNTFADERLAENIQYSLTAGAGDIICEYDPTFNNGDNRLQARDCRDTIPIRPGRTQSLQDWEGVIIREAHSVNHLKRFYPEAAHLFTPDISGKWGSVFTRFIKAAARITSPMSTLDGVRGGPKASALVPECTLYRVYLKDGSVNLNDRTVLMGKPGTSWSYLVEPGKPLYPRKRLILCTEKFVIYDGPNPDWHGMFPISRLKLDPWPWVFLGLSKAHDLMPMQDGLNEIFNEALNIFALHANRGQIADANAMPESQFRRLDVRKPGWKAKVKATMGESFKLADPPNLPSWFMQFTELLFKKFDDMAGTANLQSLMQLRQMPSADTIQKYYESLTPELKREGRLLEAHLRDVAEMIKCNIFQYYSKARRIAILGDAGKALSDFDYDPGSLVPAMAEGEENYIAELDKDRSRDARAQFFHKLFSFYVAPNSILAMHAQEEKMMYLQLTRQGMMDRWTLADMLEIPNYGTPPPIPLPIRDWKPTKDPITGIITPPPMEIRIPQTVTEKLMAEQMLGMGQQPPQQGRPPSGQAPPSLETKSDGQGGQRQTVSESGK